ncbi:MAG TPA: precorrin-6y C5,15-methyltransferase (decarboxylating) subunit CbiE [Prosthecochloris aestuarii]|uniref:Precorrin-6y C5,15-methyltransferase (Decarboxylating) subunit CbiE n=1 Tax=Prosthecochloris aestuarii TaxID=1102 RepID=A0A831SQL9_PROAE|nr:precorrin-6y C5,15-methyltransferase (decarboxylating) subunit CbiE [Prosthecochloris sp.]HED31866.1 precorrin-6y C5,15-methyltransferase (decarboxylating) subunit CbiE [Prosthecochloris aestuarii]
MSEKFLVIGLSDSREPFFSSSTLAGIASCRVFAGGVRHHAIVRHLLPRDYRWITIAPPMKDVMQQLGEAREKVVVFTSGDPLFYGFGATLQKHVSAAEIRYLPAFSSLQMLAHRLGMPYESMRYASLTGRSWQELDRLLIEGAPLIGVLTDKRKTPAAIAERLLGYGYGGYSMVVGEALGGPEERIVPLQPVDAAGKVFHDLNCVVLRGGPVREKLYGIDDAMFEGLPGRPDMITKMPLRLATLSRLDLVNCSHFWDIGFCTGSVSIEARLQFPHLEITAFEKRSECEGIFERNARRFGAPGVRVVMGDMLKQEPDEYTGPDGRIDAVFIGGHGGQLEAIFDIAAERLSPGGRVVVNAVRSDTLERFHARARHHALRLLDDLAITPGNHNPITIAAAVQE